MQYDHKHLKVKSVPDVFYNYLNSHLTSFDKTEKEVIRLIFTLGYKGCSRDQLLTDHKILESIYPNYTIDDMIKLCEHFVLTSLKQNTELFETINILHEKFEKRPT